MLRCSNVYIAAFVPTGEMYRTSCSGGHSRLLDWLPEQALRLGLHYCDAIFRAIL